MTFEMQMMIMVALVVYILTSLVGVLLTLWIVKTFGPMYKRIFKQMNEKFCSEKEEAE